MAEGFRQVGHMGLATGMLIGGAAAAYQRGVNRAVAWQNACDAEAIRQDEVGAFRRLMAAFKTERSRANAEKARADGLQAELDRLRLEHVRLLRRQ